MFIIIIIALIIFIITIIIIIKTSYMINSSTTAIAIESMDPLFVIYEFKNKCSNIFFHANFCYHESEFVQLVSYMLMRCTILL